MSLKGLISKKKQVVTASILFVLLYFFRQLVYYIKPEIGYQLVGNLDLLYIFGLLYLIPGKKSNKTKKWQLLLLPVTAVYILLQSLLLYNLDITRSIINITKIALCFLVLKYSLNNTQKISIKLITSLFGVLCLIFILVAFIFYDSNILWRLNDTVNVFDLHRLKLFYTEPGELGMHCAIMAILSIGELIKTKNQKIRYALISILPVIACLALTRSLGGIAVGLIAYIVLIVSNFFISHSKRSLLLIICSISVLVLAVLWGILSNNTLYLRASSVIKDADSSSRYRITTAFTTTPAILADTHLLGIGFGNLELPDNVNKYSSYGLVSAGIINSFMNFISEGGVLSICLVGYIIYKILSHSIRSKDPTKIGLAAFIILYQFMGTYFTNPLCWICYAYILHDNKKEQKDTK